MITSAFFYGPQEMTLVYFSAGLGKDSIYVELTWLAL